MNSWLSRISLTCRLAWALKNVPSKDLESVLEEMGRGSDFRKAVETLLNQSSEQTQAPKEPKPEQKPEPVWVGEEPYKCLLTFSIHSSGWEYASKGWVVATKEGPRLALKDYPFIVFAKVERLKELLLQGDSDNEEMKAAIAMLSK